MIARDDQLAMRTVRTAAQPSAHHRGDSHLRRRRDPVSSTGAARIGSTGAVTLGSTGADSFRSIGAVTVSTTGTATVRSAGCTGGGSGARSGDGAISRGLVREAGTVTVGGRRDWRSHRSALAAHSAVPAAPERSSLARAPRHARAYHAHPSGVAARDAPKSLAPHDGRGASFTLGTLPRTRRAAVPAHRRGSSPTESRFVRSPSSALRARGRNSKNGIEYQRFHMLS